MKWITPPVACLIFLATSSNHAADPDGAEISTPHHLTAVALNETLTANDPRIARTRDWLKRAMRATGETERAIAQACLRNASYLRDVTKNATSPLEILEALALHAPSGKPLTETTHRYFDLRAKQKLDHAAALAAMSRK
jgi:hypothetical protein